MSNPRSPTSPSSRRMPAPTLRRASYASVAAGTNATAGSSSQTNTGARPVIAGTLGQTGRRVTQVIDSGDEDEEEDEEDDGEDDDEPEYDEEDEEDEDEDEGYLDPVVELPARSGDAQAHWDATIPNSWRHTRHHHRSTALHDRSGLRGFNTGKPNLHRKELRPSYLRNTKYMESLDEHYKGGAFLESSRLEDDQTPLGVAMSSAVEGQHKWSGHAESGPLFLGGAAQRSHRGASYNVIERPPRTQEPTVVDPSGFTEPPISLLPTYFWDYKKAQEIDISKDGLRITFTQTTQPGNRSAEANTHNCRTHHHIPSSCGLYYFEMTINTKSNDAIIAIGVTSNENPTEKLPGWDTGSWGYHGDAGQKYGTLDSTGRQYGPTFGANDIVGCGVNLAEGTIFFTKNGQNLGVAFRDFGDPEKLYPCIGSRKPSSVTINLGASAFQYDIDAYVETVRTKVKEDKAKLLASSLLSKVPDTTTMTRSIVAQYLKHGGYIESAKAFASEAKKVSASATPFQDISSVGDREDPKRQEIRAYILDGDIDKAIEETESNYSKVLKDDPKVFFYLRCQKWVEMMRKTSENFALNKHSSKPTSPAPIPAKLLALQSLNTTVSEQPFTAAQKQKTPARFSPTFMDPPAIPAIDVDTSMDLDAFAPDSRAVSPWGSPSASMRSDRYMTDLERESFEKARLYAEELNHDYEESTDEEIKTALSNIFILFAMDPTDDSPLVRSLMDEKARVHVAELLDAAILVHQNQNPKSALEVMVRQTDVLLDEISTWKGPGAFVNLKNDVLGSYTVVGAKKRAKSD